jgi:hypothetical protein
MSRAQLYNRIRPDVISRQKEFGRTHITRTELERHVESWAQFRYFGLLKELLLFAA